MKKSELKEGYGIFGNRGAVFNNECHIFKHGFNSNTLCGTPMLSTNHAQLEGIEEIGCENCIREYLIDNLDFRITFIKPEDENSVIKFSNGATLDLNKEQADGYCISTVVVGNEPKGLIRSGKDLMVFGKLMEIISPIEEILMECPDPLDPSIEYYMMLNKEEFNLLLTLKE